MIKPKLKRIADRDWLLQEDWQTPFITVKAGYYNGPNVPYIFRWLFPLEGKLLLPSLIHDYMYREAIGSKSQADSIFYKACVYYGENKLKAKIAYYAVKLFGEGNYEH